MYFNVFSCLFDGITENMEKPITEPIFGFVMGFLRWRAVRDSNPRPTG